MKNLRYSITNENIYTIKEGLNPHSGDNVYSIFGSGDIPLMCIENNAKVLGVDINKAQLDYGNQRIDALKSGNINNFKNIKKRSGDYTPNFILRDIYFEKMNHKNVKKNLKNLNFLIGDFFNLEQDQNIDIDYKLFNKVYLSNAFDYVMDRSTNLSNKKIYSKLDSFFDKFNSGTLFYVASFLEHDFDISETVFNHADKSKIFTKMESFWNISILEKI